MLSFIKVNMYESFMSQFPKPEGLGSKWTQKHYHYSDHYFAVGLYYVYL